MSDKTKLPEGGVEVCVDPEQYESYGEILAGNRCPRNCGSIHAVIIDPDELRALRAENERLWEALEEVASDLEVEVNARYSGAEEAAKYPTTKRRYERDMAPVERARALLEEADDE